MSTSCCHCVFLSMYSPLIVWIPEENDIQLIELLIMGIHLFISSVIYKHGNVAMIRSSDSLYKYKVSFSFY
jgi:hypothetical protein